MRKLRLKISIDIRKNISKHKRNKCYYYFLNNGIHKDKNVYFWNILIAFKKY